MWPFKYPYTNFHELNLDWILDEIKSLKENYKEIPALVAKIVNEITSPESQRCYINVKTYGAMGDGIADDTASIQAAIDDNTGAVILIPEGTYNVTSPINLWRSGKNSIIFAGGCVRAMGVVPSIFNVGNLKDGEGRFPNYPTQGISGYGVIDCNALAGVAIDIADYALYCHITDVQIRNASVKGIRIGTLDTISSQCIINNVGVYGVSGTLNSVAIETNGSDNIICNVHAYLCGTGLDVRSDVIDNVHVWVDATKYPGTILNTRGVRVKSSLYGGFLYLDTVGEGVYLEHGASLNADRVNMLTDTPIDNAVFINAEYDSLVNIGAWRVSEGYTNINPLLHRNYDSALNGAGGRYYTGKPDMKNMRHVQQPNELCNACYNPVPTVGATYAKSMPAGYYKIGYVAVATTNIKMHVACNNAANAICYFKIASSGTVTKNKIEPLETAYGDEIVFGAMENINGRNYCPVYYHAIAERRYNFIEVIAEAAGGVGGYYPIFNNSALDLERLDSAPLNSTAFALNAE